MITSAPPSPTEEWRDWPIEQKRRFLRRPRERRHGAWRCDRPECDGEPHERFPHKHARGDQQPPDKEWTTLLLSGGRGSGKTWGGAHILVEEIEQDPAREKEGPGVFAIVAPTFADARDKCVEGESGLLAALHTTTAEVKAGISPTVAVWNRSLGEVVLHDGTKIVIDG